MNVIIARVEELLSGNPARFIGYGAAIVVWLVVALANHLGFTRLGSNIDLPTALGLATAAIATVVSVIETIRKFVYSPATVDAIRMGRALTPTPLPAGSEPS